MAFENIQGGADIHPLDRLQWTAFRNDSGEEIPANGILRITDFENDPEQPYFIVDKPDEFGAQFAHAINNAAKVPAGEYGSCVIGAMVPALYDGTGGVTPAIGEFWGPTDDSWKLSRGSGGFQIMGVISTTDKLVLVTPAPLLSFTAECLGFSANGTIATFKPRYGDTTIGSEQPTTFTVDAFVRRGLVFEGFWYELGFISPADDCRYEVRNPTLSWLGYADADIAKNAVGNVSVWTTYGSFNDTGETLSVDFKGAGVASGDLVKVDWCADTWQGGGEC